MFSPRLRRSLSRSRCVRRLNQRAEPLARPISPSGSAIAHEQFEQAAPGRATTIRPLPRRGTSRPIPTLPAAPATSSCGVERRRPGRADESRSVAAIRRASVLRSRRVPAGHGAQSSTRRKPGAASRPTSRCRWRTAVPDRTRCSPRVAIDALSSPLASLASELEGAAVKLADTSWIHSAAPGQPFVVNRSKLVIAACRPSGVRETKLASEALQPQPTTGSTMRKIMLALAAATLAVPALPSAAFAHDGYYKGRVWRDSQRPLSLQAPQWHHRPDRRRRRRRADRPRDRHPRRARHRHHPRRRRGRPGRPRDRPQPGPLPLILNFPVRPAPSPPPDRRRPP